MNVAGEVKNMASGSTASAAGQVENSRKKQTIRPKFGWQASARCISAEKTFSDADFAGNERIYDPESKKAILEARSICFQCPVRTECLDSAMVEERFDNLAGRTGIRGGFTARERMQLAATEKACASCGRPNPGEPQSLSHVKVTCSACSTRLNKELDDRYSMS